MMATYVSAATTGEAAAKTSSACRARCGVHLALSRYVASPNATGACRRAAEVLLPCDWLEQPYTKLQQAPRRLHIPSPKAEAGQGSTGKL